AADQDAFDRNFINRRRDRAARGLDFDPEAAGQLLAPAAFLALALPQQHGAARFEFLRKCRDGPAGLGDAFAVRLGLPGREVDLGGALADRDDEVRGGSRVVGHFAGGPALLGYRAVDVVEHRADQLDRLRDAVHGVDRAGGVALQRLDLPGDLFGGVLGLHRERL